MNEVTTPEIVTSELAASMPIGTIAEDARGYWAATGRRHLKTSSNTWAVFFREPSQEQIAAAIRDRVNNVSPAPLGAAVNFLLPELFPGTREALGSLSIRK